MISTRNQIIISVIALTAAFAFGRYSVNQPTIQTTEQINKTEQDNKNKDVHTITTTTVVKTPDGTEKSTTTVDTTSISSDVKHDQTNTSIQQTITPSQKNTLNISALAGIDFRSSGNPVTYGASVSKQFIGPITMGVYGLTNGNFGVSLGLNF